VTGIDLVSEQVNVAAGASLSFKQEEVRWRGHAIECRVYAEDPENNFFPSPGRIAYLRVPSGPGIRDDSGVVEGAEVSIHYDPMISKLAAWGRTRAEAIDRMRRALDEYAIGGIKTTLSFFREIVRDEEFIAARLDTGFISRFTQRRKEHPSERPLERPHPAGGSQASSLQQAMALIAAALLRSLVLLECFSICCIGGLLLRDQMKLRADIAGESYSVDFRRYGHRVVTEIDDWRYELYVHESGPQEFLLIHDGRVFDCRVE